MANAVEVKNVTMEFNMSKEKVDSIKEYFIKLVKRELHFGDSQAYEGHGENRRHHLPDD